MTRHLLSIACSLLVVLTLQHAAAYETETHALITRKAIERSVLTPLQGQQTTPTLTRFGLDRLDVDRPFSIYWDATDPSYSQYYIDGLGFKPQLDIRPNRPEDFERCQMQEFLNLSDARSGYRDLFTTTVEAPGNSEILSLSNWIVRGAIREDDLGAIFTVITSMKCQGAAVRTIPAQYDPWITPASNLVRVFNHFYDPVWNTPMWGCPAPVFGSCYSMVDWALGNSASFAYPSPIEDTGRRNAYSYRDARNALWAALTQELLKPSNSLYTAGLRELDAQQRMFMWATTFRSLGDVLHVLEDSAQPQHTRNDPHSILQSLNNFGEQSAFELYTNERVLGGTADQSGGFPRAFFADGSDQLDPVPLGFYPIVTFSSPQRFFSTRGFAPNPANNTNYSIPLRAGLADFTNANFFTGGTLPPDTDYGTPHSLPPVTFFDSNGQLANGYGVTPGRCRLLQTNQKLAATTCTHFVHPRLENIIEAEGYPDYLPPRQVGSETSDYSAPNMPIASKSVFADLVYYETTTLTALSIDELDNLANVSVPRAVGYSAGLINFFFRGKLDLTPPPDGLYGVVDQGTPHSVVGGVPVLSDGKTTFGFTGIRLRVKNRTNADSDGNPTLHEADTNIAVPQSTKRGTDIYGNRTGFLVAIAHYHRNPCYKSDLSGEYVTSDNQDGSFTSRNLSGCDTVASQRTAYPEASVSAAILLDENGNLPGGSPSGAFNNCINIGSLDGGVAPGATVPPDCVNDSALLEFDFRNDPIPVNATDLFLQVAYYGPLGNEDDGIAVGTIDILEPNYITVFNNSDYYYYNDVWTRSDMVPLPDEVAQPVPVTSDYICFNSQLIGGLAIGQQMNAREFMRIGVLADDTVPFQFGSIATFRGQTYHVTSGVWPGIPRQSDKENGGTFVNYSTELGVPGNAGMSYARGVTGGWWDWYYLFSYNQDGPVPTNAWQIEQLTPALGSDSAPGIPLQTVAVFDSSSNPTCQQYFPGPYSKVLSGLPRSLSRSGALGTARVER